MSGHGLPTTGYRGWLPLKFREGKGVDGTVRFSEGFKNVDNNQEVFPENGHSGEPPYPTGDMANVRHVSGAYREGWERIWGPGSAGQPRAS